MSNEAIETVRRNFQEQVDKLQAENDKLKKCNKANQKRCVHWHFMWEKLKEEVRLSLKADCNTCNGVASSMLIKMKELET